MVYRDILARFVIADFGQMRAQDLRRSDVARLHRDLANTPRQANHMLAVVSKLYNWAKIEGYVPSHSENPARDIEKYRESKRERYLSETELARLGKVLAESETEGTASPYAIAALRLLIFTGARLSEILTLRWSDIDLERRLLRLPEGKTGPRDVYLSAPALEVLSALPRLSNNPYVIVGGKAGSHIINLRKPWVRMRPRAGLDDVRIHDLRHSYASVGVSGGLSLPIIGKLLGHTQIGTTERYSHLADDPVRAANEAVGRKIDAALKGKIADVLLASANRR